MPDSARSSKSLAHKLESVQMFGALSDVQRERLLSYAVLRRFPKNQMILSMGEQSNSLFVILSGGVKILRDDEDGREVIVSLLGAGEFFGEMGILDDEPRSANVITTESSEMIVFSKNDFLTCMAENFEICLYMMKALAKRLRASTEKIETLALMDVYGRVARLLLDMAEDRNGQMVIVKKFSKQDIGRMIGASREMVSRVMKDLTDRGLIQSTDQGLVLTHRFDSL